VSLLSLSRTQVDGQSNSSLHVLAVGVDTDGLRACEGTHLLCFAVDGDGGQLGRTEVVAQSFLDSLGIPGAGEEGVDGALSQAGQAGTVGVHREVCVVVQVHQILGNCNGLVAAEVEAGGGIHAALTEDGAAVCVVESCDVPGVGQGECDLALLQHGVQRLHVVLAEDGGVIVHEPGVAGERHAVHAAVGAGDRVDHGIGVVVQDLIQVAAAQLCNGVCLHQGAQLVVCEHVDVGSCGDVLGDVLACVALGADLIGEGDVPLGVCIVELLAHGGQPAAGIHLIFLGAPDLQGNVLHLNGSSLGAAGCCRRSSAGAAAAAGGQSSCCGQSAANGQERTTRDLFHNFSPP